MFVDNERCVLIEMKTIESNEHSIWTQKCPGEARGHSENDADVQINYDVVIRTLSNQNNQISSPFFQVQFSLLIFSSSSLSNQIPPLNWFLLLVSVFLFSPSSSFHYRILLLFIIIYHQLPLFSFSF